MLGSDHGFESKSLSKYEPPFLSKASFYKQYLGHTVRIDKETFSFLFEDHCGTGNRDKHNIMTWNVYKPTHLPAGQSLKSLL